MRPGRDHPRARSHLGRSSQPRDHARRSLFRRRDDQACRLLRSGPGRGRCDGSDGGEPDVRLPAIDLSQRAPGADLWLAEAIATFGLVLVVFGVVRAGRESIAPFAVGAYIGAAYFFTASTSFANPAVTMARTLSDTFAGIAPGSAPGFVVSQCVGGFFALLAIRALYPRIADVADRVVVPHVTEARHRQS